LIHKYKNQYNAKPSNLVAGTGIEPATSGL
jgi:hypothetical protein